MSETLSEGLHSKKRKYKEDKKLEEKISRTKIGKIREKLNLEESETEQDELPAQEMISYLQNLVNEKIKIDSALKELTVEQAVEELGIDVVIKELTLRKKFLENPNQNK